SACATAILSHPCPLWVKSRHRGTSNQCPKWLALLKEIAPSVTRTAVLRNPSIAVGMGQLGAIQAVAPSLVVELTPIDARHLNERGRAATGSAGRRRGAWSNQPVQGRRSTATNLLHSLRGFGCCPPSIHSAISPPTAP